VDRDAEYHLFLSHVNTLIDRRQAVTTTYISVNTAIIGSIAFLFKDGQLTGWIQQLSVGLLLISGVIACDLWRKLIAQYHGLLSWWYQQLRVLESNMPESTKLITHEYQELYVSQHSKKIKTVGLTRYEVSLTWLFTLLFVVFGGAILISVILSLF
jgi:hypothetical protein